VEKTEIILSAPREVVELGMGLAIIAKAVKAIAKDGLKAEDIPAFMLLLADPKVKAALEGVEKVPLELKEDTLGSALGLGLSLLQELKKA